MSFFINFFFIKNIDNLLISPTLDAAEAYQFLFQCPATMIMDNIIDLHHDIFSIMLVIATVVFYLLIVIIYKFRAGNTLTKRNFNFTHHTNLEIVWTLVPMLILLLILIPSFVLLYSIDELHDSHITFKILGRQWYWTYEFILDSIQEESNSDVVCSRVSFDSYLVPDSDLPFGGFRLLEVDNRVKLPVEIHTRVLVTSSDVLHSWAVPSFGVKMDACPGRLNQFNLYLYRLGVFYGQCSEICGVNHGFMPIVVEGVLVHEYSNWLRTLIG